MWPSMKNDAAFDWKQRTLALGYGAVCHIVFLVAVGFMVLGLYTGMSSSFGPFEGYGQILANCILALQFPLLHSLMLSRRGSRLLSAGAPGDLGRSMATTTYVIFASLQILLVFALWSPSGVVLWEATGPALRVSQVLYGVSWLLVVKTMGDAGLGTQLGYKGWLSVARGQSPRYGGFPKEGSFRYCRQPVYAAFALTLWTGPVLTVDRLMLATIWTTYCVLGPVLKERRYLQRYGESFRDYQRAVPFMVPRLRPAETRELEVAR
jgi:protein-S-isoprenylcysteine O-methyltransferase Ste14